MLELIITKKWHYLIVQINLRFFIKKIFILIIDCQINLKYFIIEFILIRRVSDEV